jgi:hypothetical protein
MNNIGTKLQTLAGGQMHQVNEAIDHIRGALIAFGIAKVKEFLSTSVPGLEQHLAQAMGSHHQAEDTSHSESAQQWSGNRAGSQHGGNPGTGGGSSDYRSGTQNYSGSSSSYGTGSSVREGNSGPSAASNTGRASEADDYAGVGSGSSVPRQTP